MKTKLLFIIFLLTLNTICFSQSNWNNFSTHDNSFDVTVHQDTKFIFIGDDRGNETGTIDIVLKVEIPIYKFTKSHIIIFPSYEYAELNSGFYRRYSVGVGYILNHVYFKNLNIGVLPNVGAIYRGRQKFTSYGLGIEASYRLTKRFSLLPSSSCRESRFKVFS